MSGPGWASALGIVAVVLGVFLVALHGNELMKQAVIAQPTEGGLIAEPECPPDELEEEGVSLAECEQLVAHVRTITVSRPDWFRSLQMALSALGVLLAFGSILIGGALLDNRRWAPGAAVLIFAGLAAIDLIGFIAVINAGPLLRALYLWHLLLWFIIHLMMMVAAVVGRQGGAIVPPAVVRAADTPQGRG